ncbi:MAG TPA: hybrid sensor histidine kinase/response regulator [Anaerolineales bacterium]|nr:hybrid sensor histidine kinase/response regulator [Anaerolineales bacterium]
MANILVVEDEQDLLQVMSLKLMREGHAVFTAENGQEALLKVEEYAPDLVILDVMLPEMSGWEICTQIRQRSAIPIIMVTALSGDADVIRGLDLGADEYVTKPFQLQTLVARVNAILRRLQWDRDVAEKEVDGLKRSITAMISHELRTPLAAIMGTLDLALQEAFQDNQDAQRDFIHDARMNVVTMRQLVDDLLTMVRIDQGLELLRRPTFIQIEIKRMVEIYEDKLREHRLVANYTCADELTANIDQQLFRQALQHLFSNAIKFSPEGGQIWIVAEPLPGGGVEIDVHDQGKGIAPDNHEVIFERFYQIDMSSHRKYDGLGIGLFIARAIARAHGGDVTLISTPEHGSIFSLSLPGDLSDS